jgi:putative ABC transport system ATP-binding protein
MMQSASGDGIAVEAVDLVKAYGAGESAVVAVRGVSFRIGTGERVALLGKSGSGKSTLLNLLAGLDRPSSGRLKVAGRDLSGMSRRQMADYRLATVGMIFQSYNLIASQTAVRNLELPTIFSRRPKRERQQAARDALQAVGLQHRLHHRPAELSGGEQQRVAIARALMNRPEVLLADEPTGNLDSKTSEEIERLLLGYVADRRTTFILVTHDEDLALRAADRVLRIQDGALVD